MSNRDNVNSARYYQLLANIISVFWEFHKARLESGYVSFDAQELLLSKKGEDGSLDIISEFSSAVYQTVCGSWRQFVSLNMGVAETNINFFKNIFKDKRINRSARRFVDPYVKLLLDEAYELGENANGLHLSLGEFSITEIVDRGLGTGSKVPVYLKALLGENFSPNASLAVSKVEIEYVTHVTNSIGIFTLGSLLIGLSQNYNLLDGSELGVDKNMLRDWGLGSTLGCPAGMKIDRETKEFLLQKGIDPRGTMLEDFTLVIAEGFEGKVRTWYKELSPSEKDVLRPENCRILDGIRYKEAVESKRCPYNGERK